MRDYWIYTLDDEKGTVQPGETPEEALQTALDFGWDPGRCEIWAIELGALHSMGPLVDGEIA